ncbi:hypothetical protein SDC9_71996 [bioreactor metagenome]|uniref:Uncharacterized protein n=1 Tax=bioreactor metagenome TaxID=1076179 RepID=A0A644YC75_9ZZZZ
MIQSGGTAPTIEELKKSGFLDSTLRPPVKALGRQLNTKQYEIDQNLNRAFLQLDENTRFYANSTLPL